MATRLFVGNLPENTTEKDVHATFSQFGEIKNLDLKSKSGTPENKKFAFVTLAASNNNIESCIRHFSIENFKGSKLYVTRARESFLERLQRERESEKQRLKKIEETVVEDQQPEPCYKEKPVELTNTPYPATIRRFSKESPETQHPPSPTQQSPKPKNKVNIASKVHVINTVDRHVLNTSPVGDRKKNDSEKKRIESLQKKRAEFKQKQNIIKNSLTGIDQIRNKKVIFSHDDEDKHMQYNGVTLSKTPAKTNTLFDEDDDSDNEVSFEIKKQYEGKMGKKVLDLQSRYKSDKRFILDERFVEEDQTETAGDDKIELQQTDEKAKQLDILQDVLGVTLKRKLSDDDKDKKTKPKLGMLRFDPSHPEHARFLAPVEDPQPPNKKSKRKEKAEVTVEEEPKVEEKRPEVSKEQFYKVSDTLKEAIAQPTQFSLRSLFASGDNIEEESKEEENANYIQLESTKKPKVKNPLDPGERNPFVYDSSDSETEDVEKTKETLPTGAGENKAVWKESLFFAAGDQRLKDGLAFFNSITDINAQKGRRELKSVMKKRIYNKERQNQMFRKKIGGRKKTMKKSFQKRN